MNPACTHLLVSCKQAFRTSIEYVSKCLSRDASCAAAKHRKLLTTALRCRWHETVVDAILEEYLRKKGVQLEEHETARWFIKRGLIGPIQASWMFLSKRTLTAVQSRKLPSSKFFCKRMLRTPEEFPELLIVYTEGTWPDDHPVMQQAELLERLIYVSDDWGSKRKTSRSVTTLSEDDGKRVRSVILDHLERLR